MNQTSSVSMRRWIVFGVTALLVGVVVLIYVRWPGAQIPAEPPADVKPSPKGWQIRYNANLALAVKGSKQVRLDLLREMLDEQKQLKNFRVRLQSGQEVPDETGARRTVLNTLKAIAEWHQKLDVVKALGADNQALAKVYGAIDDLAQNSPNIVVRQEAERTRQALHRS
jgi:hypothetical protein